MTKLTAVNLMLEWIGQPPVTGLDSGGTSEEGEAEAILDRESRVIQSRGWWSNTDLDTTLSVCTAKIAVTGGSGTFEVGETVTESVSGATGTFGYLETVGATVYMRLVPATGTLTGGHTLTGGTSGATKTGVAASTATTSRLVLPGSWLSAEAAATELADIAVRNGALFDVANGTPLFSVAVRLRVCSFENFESIPEQLANYICRAAAYEFLRAKRPGDGDDTIRRGQVVVARLGATREDEKWRKTNLLTTSEQVIVLGSRRRFVGTSA